MKNSILLYFIFFLLSSCNFSANVSHENELSEKENAEAVVAKLYWYTGQNEFDKIPDLFSKTFFETSNTKELLAFIKNKKSELGDFKDYKLSSWKTHRSSGTNPVSQYLLIYNVQYSNQNTTEDISLVKENNKIVISGYRVNKD